MDFKEIRSNIGDFQGVDWSSLVMFVWGLGPGRTLWTSSFAWWGLHKLCSWQSLLLSSHSYLAFGTVTNQQPRKGSLSKEPQYTGNQGSDLSVHLMHIIEIFNQFSIDKSYIFLWKWLGLTRLQWTLSQALDKSILIYPKISIFIYSIKRTDKAGLQWYIGYRLAIKASQLKVLSYQYLIVCTNYMGLIQELWQAWFPNETTVIRSGNVCFLIDLSSD